MAQSRPSSSTATEDTLVSVLMPCYNHERYVALALESIANSTHGPLELIFIDDASQDRSFEIALTWLEAKRGRFARVVVERHEANRGISATLNELVSRAKGTFVTFIASDDMLIAEGIAAQVDCAVQHDAAYVFADAALIDESGDLIAESALRFHGRSPGALQRRNCLIVDVLLNWEVPWTRIFIRANLLRRLGMFDETLSFEDRDFVVRVLTSGSFMLLPQSVYCYRLRINDRLTPGLDAAGMRLDYQLSEAKNYRAASGLIRLILGLNVMAGRVRFDERGIARASKLWPIFALLRRFLVRAHLAAMR